MSAFVLWYSVVCLVSTVAFTQAIQCQGTAKYILKFQAEWTSQSHPDFPSVSGPHFSAVVGCSHKADYVMWAPGIKATTGVKDVAERGQTGALNSEMDAQISNKKAFNKYEGSNSFISPTGTSSITNIEVNSEFPLVSFITMIAPSPDWFVGVHDFDLCNTTTGEWEDSRGRDLPLYDAGTDSGTDFTSLDKLTNPSEDIELITNNTEGSLKTDKPLKRFGTLTFEKTHESKPSINPSSSVGIQPSTNVIIESYTTSITKESSTQKLNTKSIPSTTPNVPNQTPDPTSTLTASASTQTTTTPTSAACSLKQHGFFYVVFAIIVKYFL